MSPTELEELLTLAATVGKALGEIVHDVEQHRLETIEDGITLVLHLTGEVATALGEEKFRRFVDLCERADNPQDRARVARLLAALPLVEALPVKHGLQLVEQWMTYATNPVTKDIFWTLAAGADPSLHAVRGSARGH